MVGCWTNFSDLGCCLVEKREHLVLAAGFLDNHFLSNDLLVQDV
jgi:hypothetical protein